MSTIIFKISHFPLTSETFIVNHIVETIKMGFDVKILVQTLHDFESSTQKSVLEDFTIRDKIIFQDYKIPKRRTSRITKAGWLLIINLQNLNDIIKYFKVKKRINASIIYEWCFFKKFRKTDLFHVQYGTNSKPLDDLKKSRFFKMPVVVTFHGHDSFFPINGFIKKEGYYDKLFETAELFTANTPYLKNQLFKIDCPLEKIRTLPLPVDTSYFTPRKFRPLDDKHIKLLSVGRLEKIKGHHLGIQAVDLLVKKGYPIIYRIVGEGSCREQLEELIAKHKLENNIFLIGAASPEEIRNHYYDTDVFLMTSTVVLGDTRETQGLVTLEAQASGLPVIGFSSGGVTYTIKDYETGFLIEEENIFQFSEKLEELINNKDLYKKLSLNAPAFVKRYYSTFIMVKQWNKIYLDLLKNNQN